VYAHFGLLGVNLVLWWWSAVGTSEEIRWTRGLDRESMEHGALGLLVCLELLVVARRTGQRILRAYGITFIVIDALTFYVRFLGWRLTAAWWVQMLVVGACLMAVAAWFERGRRGGGRVD
jgi:hypothetical protein